MRRISGLTASLVKLVAYHWNLQKIHNFQKIAKKSKCSTCNFSPTAPLESRGQELSEYVEYL